MKRLIGYYKWHILFTLIVIVCIGFIFISLTTQLSPDMTICYIGTRYVNIQTFNDNKSEIERLLHDADGDGKKTANFVAYTGDLQKNINEDFAELIEAGSYDIYIADKDTFESYEDKSVFADAASYVSFRDKEYDTLTDSSGRIYATALEGNSLAQRMGIVNPDGLYIAAVQDEDEEATDYRKNGKNIAGYIVDNK